MDGVEAPELVADRYRLGRVLGRGGMGEVREAQDERLGRSVAVKLLQPSMAADDGARLRFEDEARAAAQLVHPNAVAVFDTGEHDGTPYIVMECLPGRTLADEIAEGPLAPARVTVVALQVLGALDAAHRAGIVHRDIKPGNILLTADGTAKVGDFGIAKTTEGLDHTATGMIVGTPSYLAPERISGAPATARSDLYATGVVLYEALTGTKPFAAKSALATAAAIQQAEPTPLTEAVPAADRRLTGAITRAMAKEPAARFASAEAMAAAIRPEPTADRTVVGAVAPPSETTTTSLPVGATVVTPLHEPEEQPSVTTGEAVRSVVVRGRPRPPSWAVAAGVIAVVVAVLVVLAGGRGGSDGQEVPGPLEERLQELEDAVAR